MEYSYDGFYGKFETSNKAQGSQLMGPDNIVGDEYTIDLRVEDGVTTAWLLNKFGTDVGYFDANATRRVQLAFGRGQVTRAILSFVAYKEVSDGGFYWGEMAVFCYNKVLSEVMDPFIQRSAQRISEGMRPNIDLGTSALQKLKENPNWIPSETIDFPSKEVGSAVLKKNRSVSEKMIEKGRERNIGCYVISWVFNICLIGALLALVTRLLGLW